VWGRDAATLVDGHSEETIARVFDLAMANLRGGISEIETMRKMVALRRLCAAK
jgi:hypothetical protein